MKKILITFICIFMSLYCISQTKKEKEYLKQYLETIASSSREFSQGFLDTLKSTTTVFFYPKETGLTLDSLKKAISSVWTFNTLIFESSKNLNKYVGKPGYSYFVIETRTTVLDLYDVNTAHTMSLTNTHPCLVLRTNKNVGMCRIELFNHYGTNHYFNWSPVYLKANLQMVNNDLQNRLRPDLFEEYKIKDLKNLLAEDTLYVSGELLGKYNAFKGTMKENDYKIFKSLKTPYRICTDAELYDIFITQGRGQFLFEYVKSSTFKFIKIFDMKNKQVIYKDHDNGYNLKSSDLLKIYK